MTANDDKEILDALTGTGPDPAYKRITEAVDGREWLYGIPEINAGPDEAVRKWAATESLKGAAERYARTGSTHLDDAHMEQIVSEMWAHTNPDWDDLARLERTATVINRHAAGFEDMRKR